MTAHDVLVVFAAASLLLLPGAVVLWLATGRLAVVAAGSAAATIGIGYLSGLVTGATGLRWGPLAYFCVWAVVVLAVCLVRLWVGWGDVWTRPRIPSAQASVAAVGVVAASVVAIRTFLLGLGGLSTVPQEHDMVLHTVVVANIERTGRGAPWQAFPVDLLSGGPSAFYPNGFHQFAALVGRITPDPVTALNAAMTAVFAIALPLGVAALGWLLRPRSLAPLVGAAAALVAVVAYRPVIALLHDGGILANATALALAPGAIAALLVASRLGASGILPVVLVATGAVAVHPTNIATVGVSVVVGLLAALRPGTALASLRRLAICLLPAGVFTAFCLIPFVAVGSGNAGGVAAFPRDVAPNSLVQALGTVVGQPYGGFFDPALSLSQTWIVLLSVVGTVACLVARSNSGLVASLTIWGGVLLAYLMDTEPAPVAFLTGLYYNSYVRLSGALAIFQWLASGVAVASGAWVLTRTVGWATRRLTTGRTASRLRAATPSVVGALALLSVLVVVSSPYARINAVALSERYSDPTFVRVDEDDLAAARYVSDRIEPGQRVMNNANDGSTYGYVYYGLPIVLDMTLGSGEAPYTIELLSRFDELGRDISVTEEVCRLDIAWLIADSEAPPIWAPREAFSWVEGGYLSVPPGFADLDRVPALELREIFGDVSVYQIDREALGCP